MLSAPSTLPRLVAFGRDIKLSHSVFALPFALLATYLAAAHIQSRPSLGMLALIIGCMVAGRTFAMAVNRLADAKMDAQNPRTAGRALPAGRLSPAFMRLMIGLSILAFYACTALLYLLHHNPWPLLLALPALLWLAAYSYTKRFTWLCHLWLGASLALSPIAAALATAPSFLQQSDVFLLAGMVMCWVAGFDIIYALQDVEVDRSQGLHSLPARFGAERALWASRLLHLAAVVLLVLLKILSPHLQWYYLIGVGAVIALLLLEHILIWKDEKHHMNLAFFTLNGIISLLLGGLGMADVLISTNR